MIEPHLRNLLLELEQLHRRARRWRALAIGWGVMAALGGLILVIRAATGWNTASFWWAGLPVGLGVSVLLWIGSQRRPADLRRVVAAIEQDQPGLRPLLSTAFEQEPDAESGQFQFLQLRVIQQALRHPKRHLWEDNLKRKLAWAQAGHAVALVGFVIVFALGHHSARQATAGSWFAENVTVDPGDAQVERGTGLVITAQFERQPPAEATLVLASTSKTNRIALQRHLSDPVFGTSLPQVMENSRYRIEYAGEQTRDYQITVFEYPALVRADAALRFPEFTGLPNKTIPDTLRVSAVEGTRLTYRFQLNKPLVQARLVGKEQTLALVVQSNAVALLNDLVLTNSGRYAVQLLDAEGRTNKTPADVFIQVLPDRPPDLKLTFPSGDQRVSSLQELQLAAEVSDDFGVLHYGFGYGIAGEQAQLVESGKAVAANDKRQFSQLIALEQLGVEVDQLVSYFIWAEDYGPDGKVRRTFSDMFFAEVRPFEEIFRRDPNEGSGQGQPATGIWELQKQIVIATWKLQREKGNAPGVRIR